jgi:hypothetical protein
MFEMKHLLESAEIDRDDIFSRVLGSLHEIHDVAENTELDRGIDDECTHGESLRKGGKEVAHNVGVEAAEQKSLVITGAPHMDQLVRDDAVYFQPGPTPGDSNSAPGQR